MNRRIGSVPPYVGSPLRVNPYLEHMGMGIPRKIVKSMLAHNGTMPDIIVEEERFVIRLLNP